MRILLSAPAASPVAAQDVDGVGVGVGAAVGVGVGVGAGVGNGVGVGAGAEVPVKSAVWLLLKLLKGWLCGVKVKPAFAGVMV